MCRSLLRLALGLGMLLTSTLAQAYTLGNPMGLTGKGKLVMSAEYEFQSRELPDALSTESARYLIKASYGLISRVDVFAKAGIASLQIPLQDSKFVGEDEFAGGAGIRATLIQLPVLRAEVFSCAQIFGYHNRGRVDQQVTDSPQTWTRRLDSKYIWWEYGGALGVGARQGTIWPYLGIDLSYVEGEKITTQYNIFSYGSVYGGRGRANFSSEDLILNGFGGIDLSLPHRYKLSFEIRGPSREDVSFTIGISQRSY